MDLLINSIYRATEGEGIHLGIPQIFIRFQGCAIGCVNCDSKETWDFSSQHQREIHEVLNRVEMLSREPKVPLKRISITGGDPLHPKHTQGLKVLVKELKARGYYLNLEAAGTRVIEELFDQFDFISYDFKTPSTQVKTSIKLLEQFIQKYGNKAQVKAVVADEDDFQAVFEAYQSLSLSLSSCPWVLTPCYEPSEDFPMKRFEEVIRLNEVNGSYFRVIGQQHKWVYGSEATEV